MRYNTKGALQPKSKSSKNMKLIYVNDYQSLLNVKILQFDREKALVNSELLFKYKTTIILIQNFITSLRPKNRLELGRFIPRDGLALQERLYILGYRIGQNKSIGKL